MTKKVFETINEAWRWYKRWSETPPKERSDTFWEKITQDLKSECQKHTDMDTNSLYRALLVALMSQLEEERKRA